MLERNTNLDEFPLFMHFALTTFGVVTNQLTLCRGTQVTRTDLMYVTATLSAQYIKFCGEAG